MKPTPISRPMLVGGFCGFIAAGIIGWSLSGGSPAPAISSAASPAESRKNDRPSRPSRLSTAATAAGQRLAAVRGAANPEARMRATIDLANSLPVSDFAAWMEGGYFNLRGGAELTLFTKILMERWMKEDPEGLVGWSLKNDRYQSRSILSEWVAKEPQRAIDFFKSHPDEENEMATLSIIARNRPELALKRFQELAEAGISGKAQTGSSAADLLRTLAEKSPALLEAAMASLPSAQQIQAESALSGARLKTSFTTEIRALWENLNGWQIFQQNAQRNQEMADGIFDELANLPPAWRSALSSNPYYFINDNTAQKWLDADLTSYGFTSEQEMRIKKSALNEMVRSNPEEVFKRMGQFGLNDDERRSLIQNTFSYSSSSPEKTETLIALLGTEADQNIARSAASARITVQDGSPPTKPDDWLEKISGADPKSGSYTLLNAIQNWGPEKISELGTRFKEMPDAKKQVVAQIVANNYSSIDGESAFKGEAIRYLVSLPADSLPKSEESSKGPIAASSGYAVHLAKSDPDAAVDWVRILPDGESKSWAEKNLAANWAQYDPKAVEQWLKTLPAANREEVRKFMDKK